MSKSVAFILGSMGKGGAERVISILSNEYSSKGWNTSICVLLSNEVEYELHPDTKFVDLSGSTESRVQRIPFWLKSIRRYIKTNNIDVVVSFAARINVLVMMACVGLEVRIVLSERNDPKYDGRGIITKCLTTVLYPKADCIVFQTKRVMSYFKEAVQRKSVVIPNPIEVNAIRENPQAGKIVTVGSLKEQKNHKLLIAAMHEVVKTHPLAQLHIYGEGWLRTELETQIQNCKLERNVFLPGQKSNIHEIISDASFFVLSSDYEGLSNALLEAMMMGMPCISTNCAGADEYIENEENGLLVPVSDKDALANAIITFIDDNELRERCGKNAAEVSKRVSKNNTLKQWEMAIEGEA